MDLMKYFKHFNFVLSQNEMPQPWICRRLTLRKQVEEKINLGRELNKQKEKKKDCKNNNIQHRNLI